MFQYEYLEYSIFWLIRLKVKMPLWSLQFLPKNEQKHVAY